MPRSIAGVVDEQGNIVDKDGNVVGEVTNLNRNAQQLVGNRVTANGDVVGDSGNVLGRASLDNEYTTQLSQGKKSGDGWNLTGKAKTVYNTVNKARGPLNTAMKGYNSLQQARAKYGQVAQDTAEKSTEDAQNGSPINIEDREDSNEAEKRSNEQVAPSAPSSEPAAKKQKSQDGTPVDGEMHEDSQKGVNGATDDIEDADDNLHDATEGAQEEDDSLMVQSPNPIDDQTKNGNDVDNDDDPNQSQKDDLDMSGVDGGQTQVNQNPDEQEVQAEAPGRDGQEDMAEVQNSDDRGTNAEDDTRQDQDNEEMPDADAEQTVDFSVLKDCTVNKAGNIVNDKGEIVGRLAEDSDAKKLVGKSVDEYGNIWSDKGKVIGKAEPIPESDRDDKDKDFAPFENFPDAVVEADGRVTSDGKQVGEVVQGDAKRLKGSKVDEDGDILDRRGNTVGKAQAWDEPEPEKEQPEEEPDRSLLAGKRVNKAGNVVDSDGTIYGRVVEGTVKSLVGRMCDKQGNIMSESGDKVGRAELVPEHEREGSKEGPFAEMEGLTISKEGTVVTPSGEVVGRLTSGDGKKLHGRSVDEDGDVVDKNGNTLGQAERWEEPEKEKNESPMAGRKVNREGNIVDQDGNVIGKLVSGEISVCAGKEVDADGEVLNSKGNSVGQASLLEDIPPEPEEPAEEKEAREQAEKDKKLASQLAGSVEGSLDKMNPILKMITDKVDKAENTPKEELDEEQLVKEVKPLIEEGNKILTEANGVIRGMDPDGRIQRNAKHKSKTNDASSEEHHLAEVLQEVSHTHAD